METNKLSSLLRSDISFAIACSLVCAALSIALPSHYALRQPDSSGYIAFAASRTAFYPLFLRFLIDLGLNLIQITYVQAILFHVAFVFLLLALLRTRCPRVFVALFAVALGANVGFSSLHWTILTESVFLTVSAIAVACWLDYFRSGRLGYLASVSLCVGILYGIRPAAITLMPMVVISVWLMWARRSASIAAVVLAVVLPLAVGPTVEAMAFRAEHGNHRQTIVPYMMLGKAAMVIKPDTRFSGPYAGTLKDLGTKLYAIYAPVRTYLSGVAIAALPIISSTYEGVAQFSILNDELAQAAEKTGLSTDQLRDTLGEQAILGNLPGFLRLFFINYFGQWSVTALTFPPTARVVAAYFKNYPKVPLIKHLSLVTMQPSASRLSYIVYPAFFVAGVISLMLSAVLVIFLLRPSLSSDSLRLNCLMLASFFAATCQVHTIIIALINVPTPRFLMSVYPQMLLMLIFLAMAISPRLATLGATAAPK